MPTFFNPAANLTANRIPYALGGGRLGDDAAFTFDPANKNVSSVAAVDGDVAFRVWNTHGGTAAACGFKNWNGVVGLNILTYGPGHTNWPNQSRITTNGLYPIIFSANNAGTGFMLSSANRLCVHAAGDLGNGKFQTASHTTTVEGYGFFDFSLYRSGASRLATNATNFDCVNLNASSNAVVSGTVTSTHFVGSGNCAVGGALQATGNCEVGGHYRVGGVQVVGAKKTGWESYTGATRRINYDPATITLAELAQTVGALLRDLHIDTAGHGLISYA